MADIKQKTIIAHRGASGYLPEHTLEAVAMAHGQGADYIEQDVVITKDGIPIVLHDIALDAVTDVAKVFPDRNRTDGRYYVIDLTLEEIKQLKVHERISTKTGKPVFPHRFPQGLGRFKIATLTEQLELIRGLNASTGRNVGVFTDIKHPAFHREEGQDASRIVLKTFAQHGYANSSDPLYVQCFDWIETQRIRNALGYQGGLIQLLTENTWKEAPGVDYDALKTAKGLGEIAKVADAIGPWKAQIVTGMDKNGKLNVTPLAATAQDLGLEVYPYTMCADKLPPYAKSFHRVLEIFLVEIGADGVFTDQPDLVVAFVDGLASADPSQSP
jgi:glycerophosphoryl diester phosphodiesterase